MFANLNLNYNLMGFDTIEINLVQKQFQPQLWLLLKLQLLAYNWVPPLRSPPSKVDSGKPYVDLNRYLF